MRKEDWEQTLAACLREAHLLPFTWGKTDCFIWASNISSMMGGADFAAALGLRGVYDTYVGGVRMVKERWGDATTMMDQALARHDGPKFARRGDVVLYDDFGFGIVDLSGRRIAARCETGGMKSMPLAVATAAWRID